MQTNYYVFFKNILYVEAAFVKIICREKSKRLWVIQSI